MGDNLTPAVFLRATLMLKPLRSRTGYPLLVRLDRAELNQGSATAALAPLIWKMFGVEGETDALGKLLLPEVQPRYRDWLQRIADQASG
ncbi:hypothetical protein GC087_07345 [Pantoea sp. JZ2]|uniref:hypothetical protein n=1 Tax=Pantoea sp. JZ2 TaxID=2654189 RepID=UPI002B47EA7B|nr:hypothetical protein [Pantoea sp. JZ2]WRH12448.1 hypothetical protein GC087_07345 [Pantoea sp. JZ2]